MKPYLLVAFLPGTLAFAGPAEDAIVAAMKLPDAQNYSWSTNVDDDARSYAIDGQTDRPSDLSLVNMPVVVALRRRVNPTTSNSTNLSTVAFKGDEKYAVQTDNGWKSADEIAAMSPANSRGGYGGGYGGYGGYGGWGMRRGRRGMMGGGGMGGGYPSDPGDGRDSNGKQMPAYSNLQKTLSRPHEEVAIIVAGANDLKADGDIVTGTLSDTSAKLLLVHPGQKEITPESASGTFRFWVKDGNLVKYEVKLEGKIAVITNGDRHEIEVHQTAMTELKNIGTTTFVMPTDALTKLGVVLSAPPASAPSTTPAPAATAKPASTPTAPVAKMAGA